GRGRLARRARLGPQRAVDDAGDADRQGLHIRPRRALAGRRDRHGQGDRRGPSAVHSGHLPQGRAGRGGAAGRVVADRAQPRLKGTQAAVPLAAAGTSVAAVPPPLDSLSEILAELPARLIDLVRRGAARWPEQTATSEPSGASVTYGAFASAV